jgi:osmotically-inducible protein OsmY
MEYHVRPGVLRDGMGLPRHVGWALPSLILALLVLGGGRSWAAPERIPDADINQAIETEYWADEVINPNAVDVVTDDGIVTLTGTVHSMLASERAVQIAEAIRGVRGVVNRLEVVPVRELSDTELQASVEEALLLDPATEEYDVAVVAADGIVTLTGTVGSYQEKDLCETVVKGVSGVRGIIDKVDIRFGEARSDEELQHEVVERLRNDVRVDDHLITVAVTEGVVSLFGSTGSLAEKERAVWDAWVGGVHGVETDDLAVTWSANDELREPEAQRPPTDEVLQKAVQDALVYDPRVVPFNPSVDVTDGTVTLSGVVDNLAARYAAESDADNVVGVWRVKNFLKVRPNPVVSDRDLEVRVNAALSRDPILQSDEVKVSASAGDVRLSGHVGSRYEVERADHVAARVDGVVSVTEALTYPDTWVWKPDWEIRRDLEEALARSSLVDAREVLVTVHHGVVSLDGTVATWNERSMIEQKARAAGAKEVHNDLTALDAAYEQAERPFLAPVPETP